MRLREIQKIISDNIPNLNLQGNAIQPTTITNPPQPIQQYQLTNVQKTIEAIKEMEALRMFKAEMDKLYKTSFLSSTLNSFIVPAAEYTQISSGLTAIRNKANLLLSALSDALHNENLTNETISIKMSKIGSFDDLSETIEKLKKVIQLPLNDYPNGGEIKIINFDSGSFWLDILLPSTASVGVVASIAWSGAVIYKKYQEANAFKQYANGLKIQVEHLNILKEAAKKKIDMDIEAEAKLIQNEFFTPNDNEQLGRLKLSIKEYSELIGKGVEIHSSLVAPENVSNLFPNYKTIDLIESKIKQIDNG